MDNVYCPKETRGHLAWIEISRSHICEIGVIESCGESTIDVWLDSTQCTRIKKSDCVLKRIIGLLQVMTTQRRFLMQNLHSPSDGQANLINREVCRRLIYDQDGQTSVCEPSLLPYIIARTVRTYVGVFTSSCTAGKGVLMTKRRSPQRRKPIRLILWSVWERKNGSIDPLSCFGRYDKREALAELQEVRPSYPRACLVKEVYTVVPDPKRSRQW